MVVEVNDKEKKRSALQAYNINSDKLVRHGHGPMVLSGYRQRQPWISSRSVNRLSKIIKVLINSTTYHPFGTLKNVSSLTYTLLTMST